jgi:predicted transcriptional regulator
MGMRDSYMQIPHDLFRTTALNHWDKMVLLAIIDVGRSDMPNKWNTIDADTMSRRTGIGRSTCYRSVKNLTDLGVIKVRSKYGRTNEYQVQWEALDALVEAAAIVHTVESSVHSVDDSVHTVESSVHGVAPYRRSLKEKSLQQPSSPRSNEWDDTCLLCGHHVAAGDGRLIGKEAAHRDGECPVDREWG